MQKLERSMEKVENLVTCLAIDDDGWCINTLPADMQYKCNVEGGLIVGNGDTSEAPISTASITLSQSAHVHEERVISPRCEHFLRMIGGNCNQSLQCNFKNTTLLGRVDDERTRKPIDTVVAHQALSRMEGMYEAIRAALWEIRQMWTVIRSAKSRKKNERNSGKERKERASRRHNINYKVGNDEDSKKGTSPGQGKRDNVREAKECDDDVNGSHEENEEGADCAPVYDGPAFYRTQMTLNSLRSILPYTRMIMHDTRKLSDDNLPAYLIEELASKKNKKKKKGGEKSWAVLFCPPHYDICLWGQFQELKNWHELLVDAEDGWSDFKLSRFVNFPTNFITNSLDVFLQTSSSASSTSSKKKKEKKKKERGIQHYVQILDDHLFRPIYREFQTMVEYQEEIVQYLLYHIVSALQRSSKFADCRLHVYGSSLSKLSLPGSDVDFALEIPAFEKKHQSYLNGEIKKEDYHRYAKNQAFALRRVLASSGFRDVFAVHQARVPVIKGRWMYRKNSIQGKVVQDSVSFDICFHNKIALANSTLLMEYSKLDERVRILMIIAKLWVKANEIGSAAEGTLSSYAWLNLVVFYLQIIGFVPNLQSKRQIPAIGHSDAIFIDNLDVSFADAATSAKGGEWHRPEQLVDISVTALLYGFFHFYACSARRSILSMSIRLAHPFLLKAVFPTSKLWRLSIEDPFETHDAPLYHDLGCHVSEVGQRKINTAFNSAYEAMTKALINVDYGDARCVSASAKCIKTIWNERSLKSLAEVKVPRNAKIKEKEQGGKLKARHLLHRGDIHIDDGTLPNVNFNYAA